MRTASPQPPRAASRSRCTGDDLTVRGSISLPVLATEHGPAGTVRRSRSGPRRAIVLGLVQAVLVAHIVLWFLSRKYGWNAGYTTTPIEPSESMEFVKHGVINAGLIFFALALLSTLVLGRWFCGWGCHLVMLQDLCGWIMRRLGVRPRAFRSRLLIYVPLILALYMFVWPALFRWGHGLGRQLGWVESHLPVWDVSLHLTTSTFWKTFPGILVAVPFLLVCGFAAVYFLGSKGFCTYGCPYGGFFAPFDTLATGRIRVTDACEHCGHCTAVCTSNVRVHEEVREYGMVVDPGCMKCLDCVSVCPNDALYFGFGKPAVARGPARHQTPRRRYDLTAREEIVLFALFWLIFVAVRDVYNVVPMLFAAGIAGCATYLAWKLWRLLRDQSVDLHRFRLKHRGVIRSSGWVFASLVGLLLLLTAHSGAVNGLRLLGWLNARHVQVDGDVLFGAAPAVPDEGTAEAATRAIRFYRLASGVRDGGIGLAGNISVDYGQATMLCALRRFDEAETVLRRAVADHGPQERLCRDIAFLLRGTHRPDEAGRYYQEILAQEQDFTAMLADFVGWCGDLGRLSPAIELCRGRLVAFPNDLPTLRWLSLLLMESGETDEGIEVLRQRTRLRPRDAEPRRQLGLALAGEGRLEEGLAETRRAHELAPNWIEANLQMGGLLEALGRREEAQAYYDRARELEGKARTRTGTQAGR